jgi:hypothetical protein
MSKFSLVLQNIGFKAKSTKRSPQKIKKLSTSDIHQAFINNVYFAGYLKEQIIWQAINLIDYNKGRKPNCPWGQNSQSAFLLIQQTLRKSGASQDNNQLFNPKYLLKNLFAEDIFDMEDIEDFIVYLICQNAFGRVADQERNEIKQENWTQTYHQKYLENANKIGLIENIDPLLSRYDESWVMGAGRYRTMTRIKHLKQIIDSGVDVGTIRLLSGNRELWVEIDNISDDLEAKNFMIELAKKNNIKINQQQPFITRNTSGKTRTYLNYQNNETKKLTETLMTEEIYKNIFSTHHHTTIDDNAQSYRPTTESTVKNITENIFKNRCTKNGDLKNKAKIAVMIISNQPYCKRQKLTTKRVVDKIINHKISKKIIFDAVGESAFNNSITTIHSEFAALMSEQFWQYIKKTSHLKPRKRAPHKMIFSTKHKDIGFIPPMPNY